MQKKTHVAFGILFFSVLYGIFDVDLGFAVFSVFGALLPDIDWMMDKVWFTEEKLPTVKKIWKSMFHTGMHRTILHNVWVLVGFSAVIWWIIPDGSLPSLFFALGYLSHLVADSLTKSGIYWLWPFGDPRVFSKEEKFYIKGPITTGEQKEIVLQTLIVVVIALIFAFRLDIINI